MGSHDRDRLMRDYAPRLAAAATPIKGPGIPGMVNDDPDRVGGWLDLQVVGNVKDATDLEHDTKDVPEDADATDTTDPVEPVEPVEPEDTGVMVALFLPADAAQQLALDPEVYRLVDDVDVEEPDELHLTLAYLGTAGVDVTPDQLDLFAQTAQAWAVESTPITGTVSGIGVFNNEDGLVTYASFDAPALPALRQRLVQMLTSAGFTVSSQHGFTPHITLAYGDVRGVDAPRLPVTFDAVTLAYGGARVTLPLGPTADEDGEAVQPDEAKSVPLGQDVPPEDDPDGDGADPEGQGDNDSTDTNPVKPAFIAFDHTLTTASTTSTARAITWNPIITTSGARTILTGPATVERAAMWDAVPNPNKHMLWMQGRFVGAERANRNGAYWSTQDLEVGKPTVAHGPLNWLHEERHVIGTIADAKFVPSGGTTLVSQAAQTADPHITALAAIWKWVYPTEASVVQMASDAGVLAYSMECIAQAIQCVGDNGCGQTFPYMEVAAAGGGCAHLQQRASVRRLVNPTFLGGAVIVPPTRPGWADADASVMKEAAGMAERAYDQAGRPDIPSSTWEQLMTGVVTYTRNAT